MNESLPESDDQLALKKRARRRLIGAIVFVSFAAVVLPMVMDEEAPPATPSIELNIPAQEKGFVAPPTGAATSAPVAAAPEAVPAPVAEAKPAPAAPAAVPPPEVIADAPKVAPESKPAARAPAAKVADAKPAAKPVTKRETKPAKAETAKAAPEAKRAQALLDGKAPEAAGGTADGPHVVLIGAFSNPGNVQILQKKLGELGLKVYTESLDSPQGKKTRVRAGPFPSREAAERAVARMKSIGVGGVVAPKS